MALVRRVDFKGAIISFAEKISYFKKHSMMMLHKLFQSTEQDEKLSTAFVLRVFNAFFFYYSFKNPFIFIFCYSACIYLQLFLPFSFSKTPPVSLHFFCLKESHVTS